MYDSTAVTYRETAVPGSSIKKAYSAYLPSFACMVQPMDPMLGQGTTGSFGKQWTLFCPIADYKEGDKLVVNGIDDYRITGVEIFNFGANPHAELMIKDFRQ